MGRKAQPVPAGSTVLALGDSLTYGTGAAPDAAYPTVLAGLTGWQVINAGVPGDTSAQALQRLPDLLVQHQPRLVIVSIGGNDFLRKLPEDETRAHIKNICQHAQKSGAQVLLVAVPQPSITAALGQLSDHPLYADLADELKLPLQRGGWSEVLADADLRSDAVHANAQGYARFAHSLRDTAEAIGLLKK
ncbi:MAG: GDSL-type esterase/lipase family protein [Brachymonas sp.]|nr:GDSL-type esterase/lipase family protein [Brachymonas sp.]